ncbi:MbcA/ParS/Xre antitoxin family protein [Vulgatibacter incomptus]|uniref:Uncharacterized protein n=1 Tax=Vulgatibacter incomptus TaxID=1391653 RepID=A0A0K1PDC9_9BACT|nr:antitoxin Xre/MbcA/ParS toxin-binding domain-containing protein [Vulgatibacter incomptus]AKU91507.1 hypothetical protein AKJ08_1894 [Vulgatibacter incomptus]
MTENPQRDAASEASVLTQAVLRAAAIFGLSQKELAAIVGLSPATLSRVASGTSQLRVESKEGELGILFVRIFRSLDALVGGAKDACRAWLMAYNHHLHGVPLELMQSVRGIVDVAEYLDAIRGRA